MNIRKILISIGVILLFYNPVLFAQAPDSLWINIWGGGGGNDCGYWCEQTQDGNYIFSGSRGNADVWLIKADVDGNTLWSKQYGGPGNQQGFCVKETDDGFIVVGTSTNSGLTDVYLIKTDENGDTLWTKTFDYGIADYGRRILKISDGYIILGHSIQESFDILLIKTDENGDTLWTKFFDLGIDYDYAMDIQQTPDYGYIIVGRGGNGYYYLIKTDENGDTLWTKSYEEVSLSGVCLSTPGYTVTGSREGNCYILKVDENGDSLWARQYDLVGESSESGECISRTYQNGYIVTGHAKSSIGPTYPTDILLLELIEEGNLLWSKTYGGLQDDYGKCVQQTTDRGFLVIGQITIGGSGDVWALKTYAPDVAPISIDIPQELPEDTSLYPLTTVKNLGRRSENFVVTCEIEPGGYSKNRTVSDLAPGDSMQINFFQQFIFESGTYEVTVYSRLARDGFPENDTIVKNIETYPPGIAENNVNPIMFSFGLNNNPAKNTALFNLTLPEDALITLKIYDSSGRLIDKIKEYKSAGYYQIPWNAKVAGVYLYKLETPWEDVVGKLVICKKK
jgi:hypothetical protein